MVFVLFCMLSGFGGLSLNASEVARMEGLTAFVVECITFRYKDSCDKALVKTEAIQHQAEIQRNYACQTTVLGLGAELAWLRFTRSSSTRAFSILKEASYLCAEF